MRELEAKQALWRGHGHDNFEMLDRDGIRRHVASDAYLGGMLDRSGGHMHPLNLALGEAAALERLGGVIHEASPVVAVDDAGGRPVVRTAAATVRPKALILAGNAYLGHAVPELENRVMPFSTQIMATEPLGRARAGAAADRRLRRGRALRARLLPAVGGRAAALRRRHRLRRHRSGGHPGQAGAEPRAGVPAAQGRAASTSPGRGTARSRSAGCRSSGGSGERTYFAQGYSGHGVVGQPSLRADPRRGGARRPVALRRVRAACRGSRFPGGRRFAVPYSVLGSWWYGLRDRLGV